MIDLPLRHKKYNPVHCKHDYLIVGMIVEMHLNAIKPVRKEIYFKISQPIINKENDITIKFLIKQNLHIISYNNVAEI